MPALVVGLILICLALLSLTLLLVDLLVKKTGRRLHIWTGIAAFSGVSNVLLWTFTGLISFESTDWVENNPFTRAERVARVEPDGTLVLESGEWLRISSTCTDPGLLSLLGQGMGLTGDVAKDVAATGGWVEIARTGKDEDGVTHGTAQARCDESRYDFNISLLRIPFNRVHRNRYRLYHLFRYIPPPPK